MFSDLRVHCAELQFVQCICFFLFDEARNRIYLFLLFSFQGVQLSDLRLGAIQVSVDIIYDGFQVVGRLLELPQFLVDAGLVVQSGDYHRAVDGLSAAGRVLQDLLILIEVN